MGFPSMRFLTLLAISRDCLSIELGIPSVNGSRDVVRSTGGSSFPSLMTGHIHSNDPGFAFLFGLGNSGWGEA